MARVLVLGCTAATPWTRDQLVRLGEQARSRGVRLIGADTRAGLAAAPMSRLSVVDETVAFDVHDPVASRRWARGRTDIEAVVTLREACVLPAAEIADELGLPGNTSDVVRVIATRDLRRARLRSAGFPQPRVAVCTSRREAEAFMLEHRGPWVVAPRVGSGGTFVPDHAGLTALSGVEVGPREFVIETVVRGREFSAEGVLVGGEPRVLAVTEKRTAEDLAAPLADTALAASAATVARAITAAGLTHGAFHVTFRLTPHGVVLDEVHARPADDHATVEHQPELFGRLFEDLLARTPAPPTALAA